MIKRRIGIITFHCSYNYGSALQAYALQTFLNKKGYKTEIIDYRSEDFDQYRLVPHTLSKYTVKELLRMLIFFPQYWKRRLSFRKFWKKRFYLTKKVYSDWKQLYELNNKYDIFICGGDQIWNLDCTKGVNPAFFLEFVEENKSKISYAPSMAKDTFKKDYLLLLKKAINNLDYISVREKSSLDIVRSFTDKPVSVVLDPSLLIDRHSYIVKRPSHILEGAFIFLYSLDFDSSMIDYCTRLSKIYNLPIYYITQKEGLVIKKRLAGVDVFGSSPEEFLYFIEHAKYIITNSFHATIFSVVFKKQFCVFHRDTTGMRTRDFLAGIDLTNRAYFPGFNINEIIDYQAVEKKLNKKRNESVKFLTNALRGK